MQWWTIRGHILIEPTIKCLGWSISFHYWNVPIVEEKCNYVLPPMCIGHIKIILKMTMETSCQMKLYSNSGIDKYSAIFTEENQISEH